MSAWFAWFVPTGFVLRGGNQSLVRPPYPPRLRHVRACESIAIAEPTANPIASTARRQAHQTPKFAKHHLRAKLVPAHIECAPLADHGVNHRHPCTVNHRVSRSRRGCIRVRPRPASPPVASHQPNGLPPEPPKHARVYRHSSRHDASQRPMANFAPQYAWHTHPSPEPMQLRFADAPYLPNH